MPESERPEGTQVRSPSADAPSADGAELGEEAGAVVERLAGAVERLLSEFESIRRRAEDAEASHARLSEALRRFEQEDAVPEHLEERLRELDDENRRLRSVIEQAHERASRLRSRLMVVEDEL